MPAYQRLDVDERRRRLLDLGKDLFARQTYAELSMAAIAREAGISKALLYHYFPSKQAYFVATLQQQAEELARLIDVDPALPAAEQLTRALDAFLRWVEENAEGYAKLLEGGTTHPEVRELVEQVRAATANAAKASACQRCQIRTAPAAAYATSIRATPRPSPAAPRSAGEASAPRMPSQPIPWADQRSASAVAQAPTASAPASDASAGTSS